MSMAQVIKNIERESSERCVKPPEKKYSDWMPQYQQEPMQLIVHRCPCGRLLGKFAGHAEVKCYDCGLLNIIGGENG